jgi:DivIVA domain-containing protein
VRSVAAMAMSFARPDPSSPAAVADASFGTGRRGFDQGEVREFLRMVAAELGRLQERERFLERELRTAQSNPDFASVEMDELALTRLLGEETARVLTTARESATEIRQKAEQSAAQLLSEASDDANRMREEAEIEASRRRSDAAADAEAELSMAKQQGREMVNEARAYRERVLSELARRRELAREQIEQLLHGRDRLMQSFERARLVAVDVVAELQPLGEPNEYVDLSPTTGPVPMMVPNSPRPVADAAVVVADDIPVDVDADTDTDADVEADAAVEDAVADADAPAEVHVLPDVADETDAIEVADKTDAIEVADKTDAIEVADETDAIGVTDTEPATEDATDDPRSDVVVDLFARLRADTAESDDPAIDTAVDDHDTVDDHEAATDDGDDADADDHMWDAADSERDDTVEATPFDQRDADLTPLIVASAKKLKRVLADEQNEVLDALRRREPVRQVGDLLPPPAEHLNRYRVAIVDDLLAAANAGASLVTQGRVARMKKADVTEATDAAGAVLDEWLIVPLRERLERCVADGDGDNTGITRRVRAVYREWKTQHIDEQLDDVFRAAHGRGVYAAIDDGVGVDWVCDRNHDVCADCDDNTIGGSVAAGTAFPTGHRFPPAHLGCRCLLLPTER